MAVAKHFVADFQVWIVVLASAGALLFIAKPLELVWCMVIQSGIIYILQLQKFCVTEQFLLE